MSATPIEPTRYLNYAAENADIPSLVGPDLFGGVWRGVSREPSATGTRIGLLPWLEPSDEDVRHAGDYARIQRLFGGQR